MRNSTFTPAAFDYLQKVLSSPEYKLIGLSLKFCFLSFEQLVQLAKGLNLNRSLIKLDLSNNALKSP